MALAAKSAADIERDAAHLRLGNAENWPAASRRTQCTTWVEDQIVAAPVRGS